MDVAIVSYLNTLPFIHGFDNTSAGKDFNLILATPRDCAELFMTNKVDMALIPVGVLPLIPEYNIISDYCIGCNGAVRTVCLFYENNFDDIDEILLDTHSRTSVLLIQILMKKYFNKNVKYVNFDFGEKLILNKNQAVLAIGDKVFELEKNYTNKVDLGLAWKDWTTLPFAFAVFVATTKISLEHIEKLNSVLKYGIDHKSEIDFNEYAEINNLEEYLNNNISYEFDEEKEKALGLFLEEVEVIL